MPRRKHQKSRRGCVTCKRRHVKCDERKPVCSACIDLDLACSWAQPWAYVPGGAPSDGENTSRHSTPAEKTLRAQSSGQVDTSSSHPLPPLQMQEMRLLHHYITQASFRMRPGMPQSRVTPDDDDNLLSIAFDNPYLLHVLLAHSAADLANTLPPPQARESLLISAAHVSAALPEFRVQLSRIGTSNTGTENSRPDPRWLAPVFAATLILFVQHCAVATIEARLNLAEDIESGAENSQSDPINAVESALRLMQGIALTMGQDLVEHLWRFMGWKESPLTKIKDEVEARIEQELVALENRLRHRAEQAESLKLDEASIMEVHACLEAAKSLQLGDSNQGKPDSERKAVLDRVLGWIMRLQLNYMELLRMRSPLALVVIAHFAVVLDAYGGDYWWLKGWGPSIIDAVKSQLPVEYHYYMPKPK